jgi:hypothetical protein
MLLFKNIRKAKTSEDERFKKRVRYEERKIF